MKSRNVLAGNGIRLLAGVLVMWGSVTGAFASGPAWWYTRGVIANGASTNDFALLNQGQLKHMALSAFDEIRTNVVGGAGSAVSNLVNSFSNSYNYAPVNIGMLKNVATPFYNRLIEIHYTNGYPWSSSHDNDFAAANVGQLKYAFDFQFIDTDADTLPDWWEIYYFTNLNQNAGGNPDGDGIINSQEYRNQCSPTSSDTDGDSLTDNEELSLEGTLPYDADTDGDGLSDYYELRTGEFVAKTRYYLTWSNAFFAAHFQGGHLATITSAGENSRLTNYLKGAFFGSKPYWIGGRDPAGNSNWVWITGGALSTNFNGWENGQPHASGENYLYFNWQTDGSGGWRDTLNPNEFRYILETDGVSSPLKVDSDDDGLVDGESGVVLKSTYTNGVDTNNDGFVEGELTLKAGPRVSDTDKDGVPDGLEVRHGLDPASGVDAHLAGWWPLDETNGVIVADKGISFFDGQCLHMSGDIAGHSVMGAWGRSLAFDGANDFIEMSNAPSVDAEATWCAWVNPVILTNWYIILAKRYAAWSEDEYCLYTTPGGYLCINLSSASDSTLVDMTSNGRISSNQWTHVGVTYKKDAGTRFYINGQLDSIHYQFNTNIYAGPGPLRFGWGGDAGWFYWPGKLDDIRIYDRALSEVEMGQLATHWVDPDDDGLSNSNEFALGTSPSSADTDLDGLPDNWELDHGQDPLCPTNGLADDDGDGLTNGFEYAVGTDMANTNTSGNGILDGWAYAQGFNPVLCRTSNVALWLKFNETNGMTAYDSSGGNRHAIVTNGIPVSWMPGKINHAIFLNGTNHSLDVDYASAMAFSTAFTWSVWVYPQAITNGAMVFAKRASSGQNESYSLGFSNYTVRVTLSTGGTNPVVLQGLRPIAREGWTHVAVTYATNTGLAVYLNGQPDVVRTNFKGRIYTGSAQPLRIGWGGDGAFWSGGLDDLCLFNRVLTANEIRSLSLFPTDFEPSEDWDGDGLNAYEEFVHGTDPTLADTDGDGLSDFYEVMTSLTDPTLADTDGDGLSDYEELFVSFTDPNIADTDGDGRTDGWELEYGFNPFAGVPTNDLRAWYRMDESNGVTVVNSRSNELHGLLQGVTNIVSTPSPNGRALEFNGSNAVVVAASSQLNLTTGFALSAWVYSTREAETGTYALISRQGAYSLSLNDRHPQLQLGTTNVFIAANRVANKEWSLVTASVTSNRIALYIDGSNVLAANVCLSAPIATNALYLGSAAMASNSFYHGYMDDVRLYIRGITDLEAVGLYEAGADPDGDGVNNDDEEAAGTDPRNGAIGDDLKGDLNGDGVRDAADLAILQALAEEFDKKRTAFEYDANGNLIRTTDTLGNSTTFTYDELDRRTGATDALDRSTFSEYDALGRPLREIDALNRITLFEYNAFGNLIARTDPATNVTRVAYNAVGQAVTNIDPRGVVQVTRYDAFKRVYQVINDFGGPQCATNTILYDLNDNLVTNINAMGVVNVFAYDELNRQVEAISALGLPEEASVGVVYDEAGNKIESRDGRNSVESYAYDVLNRQVAVTDRENNTTRFAYDNLGNQISMTRPNGHTVFSFYDRWGRQFKMMDEGAVQTIAYDDLDRPDLQTDFKNVGQKTLYDAVGNIYRAIAAYGSEEQVITEYAYDDANQLLWIVNGRTNTVHFRYDSLGRKISESNALGRVTRYMYNDGVNMTHMVKPDGTVIAYTYDHRNLRTAAYADGQLKQKFEYDALSRMTNSVDMEGARSNRVEFVYDALNRTVEERQNGKIVERAYDDNGNVLQVQYPSGATVARTYSAVDRIAGIVKGGVTLADYDYDVNSRVSAIDYGSGVREERGYDARERLSSLSQAKGGSALYAYTLDHDDNGNVTRSVENATNSLDYAYDLHNRVKSSFVTAMGNYYNEIWQYDAVGNWTTYSNCLRAVGETRTADAADAYALISTVISNSAPKLDYLKYDFNGNLTNYNNKTLAYDWLDRLVTVASNAQLVAKYAYDALNRRVENEVHYTNGAVTVTRLYYDNAQVIEERDASDAVVRQYVFGEAVNIPVAMEQGGQTYYYLHDWRANIRALTGSNGVVFESYKYTLFGVTEVYDSSGVWIDRSIYGNPYGFAGQRLDSETGFYDFRNREYSPTLGRFMQDDPAGYVDGLNLYAYARNNPLVFNDPYGLKSLKSMVEEYLTPSRVFSYIPAIEKNATKQRLMFERASKDQEYFEQLKHRMVMMYLKQALAGYHARRAAIQRQNDIKEAMEEKPEQVDDMMNGNADIGMTREQAAWLVSQDYDCLPSMVYDDYEKSRQQREWTLNYMWTGKVNPDMQKEMANAGFTDPGAWIQHQWQQAAEDEADDQDWWDDPTTWVMAAVAVVAAACTLGTGLTIAGALLPEAFSTASAFSFGAFAYGTVAGAVSGALAGGITGAVGTAFYGGNVLDAIGSGMLSGAVFGGLAGGAASFATGSIAFAGLDPLKNAKGILLKSPMQIGGDALRQGAISFASQGVGTAIMEGSFDDALSAGLKGAAMGMGASAMSDALAKTGVAHAMSSFTRDYTMPVVNAVSGGTMSSVINGENLLASIGMGLFQGAVGALAQPLGNKVNSWVQNMASKAQANPVSASDSPSPSLNAGGNNSQDATGIAPPATTTGAGVSPNGGGPQPGDPDFMGPLPNNADPTKSGLYLQDGTWSYEDKFTEGIWNKGKANLLVELRDQWLGPKDYRRGVGNPIDQPSSFMQNYQGITGAGAYDIADQTYGKVVENYNQGVTDIYLAGWSRGGAQTMETAWMIYERGIPNLNPSNGQGKYLVPPMSDQKIIDQVHLIDPVHSMGWPGNSVNIGWHDASLPPNIDRAYVYYADYNPSYGFDQTRMPNAVANSFPGNHGSVAGANNRFGTGQKVYNTIQGRLDSNGKLVQ